MYRLWSMRRSMSCSQYKIEERRPVWQHSCERCLACIHWCAVNTEQDEAASIDDIIETVNHFSRFDYMLDLADEELTEEMIKEFHLLLKRNTSDERKEWFRVGDYKTRPNVVGDMW